MAGSCCWAGGADAYGRATLYRIGPVVFVAASISGGLASGPSLLIASRVMQGIGAAMLAPAGLSLLVTSWPGKEERSRALGTYGAIAGHRTAVAMSVAAAFALAGLLATRVLPPGPPHPQQAQPHHLAGNRAGGIA